MYYDTEILINKTFVLFIMPRKSGPDIKKVERIRKILKKYSNGLWIRELARKSNIDKSAISRYISIYMKDEIEVEILGVIKIVRLKILK